MSVPIEITSDTILENVEQNFRVRAGPGAGKTHWLVQHISNVLERSQRLHPSARIACISYTNMAVDRIARDLGPSAERAEVSTIHSFLYRNVVKPYLRFVTDDIGQPLVAFALVDGHDEHRPTHTHVEEWLKSISAPARLFHYFYHEQSSLFRFLQTLHWHQNNDTHEWHLTHRKESAWQFPKYVKSFAQLGPQKMNSYKFGYWRDGTIDHDDVLHLAWLILLSYPNLNAFLSARFPYLYIDEFQDTGPVQTQIVKWLSQAGTSVGLIGDPQQSIYGFQGAQPSDFDNLSEIAGLMDYVIRDNHRSTAKIVSLLNHVRGDNVKQVALRKIDGAPIIVAVGDQFDAIVDLTEYVSPQTALVTLARKNETVAAIRRGILFTTNDDVWDSLINADPNRHRFFDGIVRGAELALASNYADAKRTVRNSIKSGKGKLRGPYTHADPTSLSSDEIAVALLLFFASNYEKWLELSVLDTYKEISSFLSNKVPGLSLVKVAKGKFADFAAATTFGDLVGAAEIEKNDKDIRTIHRAKGEEFENVLLILSDAKEIRYILNPEAKLTGQAAEEKRIVYVALSRARDRLFISLPSIQPIQQKNLESLGILVKDIGDHSAATLEPSQVQPLLI